MGQVGSALKLKHQQCVSVCVCARVSGGSLWAVTPAAAVEGTVGAADG